LVLVYNHILLLLVCGCCTAEKGIPGFWATVLARAELVQNEKDADALTYLTGEALQRAACSKSSNRPDSSTHSSSWCYYMHAAAAQPQPGILSTYGWVHTCTSLLNMVVAAPERTLLTLCSLLAATCIVLRRCYIVTDITCESVTGTSKQPADEEGGEETEVETTGFKLAFTFKENPYFTNTVSGAAFVVEWPCRIAACTCVLMRLVVAFAVTFTCTENLCFINRVSELAGATVSGLAGATAYTCLLVVRPVWQNVAAVAVTL
jgi:hypothetical protein